MYTVLLGKPFLRSQQHMVSPTPANQLTQLLKDQQIQDTSGGDFIVVVIRNLVPVEAFEGL
jgi:hypothetical protein